jgi:hypothetical protein
LLAGITVVHGNKDIKLAFVLAAFSQPLLLQPLQLELELARMGKYTTKSWEERYREWLERMGGVYGETHAMFLRRWVRFGGIGRVDLSQACQADFDRVIRAILAVADGNEDSGMYY